MISYKNILWICNHSVLIRWECALLRNLGWGVFIPKIDTSGISSSRMEYSYDDSIRIPKLELDVMNSFDFYNGCYNAEIRRVLNKYFQVAFCVNHPPAITNLLENFSGKVVIRAFGYEGELNYEDTTTPFAKKFSGFLAPQILRRRNNITKIYYKNRKRLFLGAAYKEVIDNETPFFKSISIYLPLGLPELTWRSANTWRGSRRGIMFVCPRIDSTYYGKIFKQFIFDFGDMPYQVFGRQNVKYLNQNIKGYISDEAFTQNMQEFRVMYYHSREPRHLHYHPLEAMVIGMPVIFMSGGLLESIGGTNHLGMAKSYEEARDKINRILGNDDKLTNEIQDGQSRILEKFRNENVQYYWSDFLTSISNHN